MSYLVLTSQFVVAGVFAVSATGKLRAPSAFVRSLADFDVPSRLRRPVAAAIIVAEVAVVPVTLVPATAASGLALAVVLLCGFAAVIARAVRSGRRARCRCFGTVGAPVRGAHVVRNVGVAALAAAGAAAILAAPAPMTITAGAVVVAGLLAVLIVAIVVGFDDLLEIVDPSHSTS